MSLSTPRILFAGGGTGGHLYPALAIADEIRRIRKDADIVFVGTRDKIEARVVPASGYPFKTIWISGFRRKLTLQTVLFPLKVVVATVQSSLLLVRLRPDVVVGTGGYVCGPPLFSAVTLGIPTLVQEQNSYPGVTTRLLASHVGQVHLTYERSRRFLKHQHNVVVTGNPTRAAIGAVSRQEGARSFGLDPAVRTLLVIGGSQGAASINSAILGVLPTLRTLGVQVLWGTGDQDHSRVQDALRQMGPEATAMVRARNYFEKIECAYAACDLAVSRAGAMTLAELTRAGVPSILVPYPFAAADHQTENAKAMEESGASVLCKDDRLGDTFQTTLVQLLKDPACLKQMAAKARALGHPQASEQLAEAVLRMAKA